MMFFVDAPIYARMVESAMTIIKQHLVRESKHQEVVSHFKVTRQVFGVHVQDIEFEGGEHEQQRDKAHVELCVDKYFDDLRERPMVAIIRLFIV